MGSTLAPLANAALGQPSMRWLLEKGLGVHRHAPMPPFAGKTFRALLPSRCLSRPPHPTPTDPAVIAYFHGCSTNYYEPDLGLKTVGVLERLGVRVVLPPQVCCGLPLQSNGFFAAARRQAGSNIASLRPFYQAGVPIIGTSTSCTLALKHDYRAILEVESAEADALARSTFDVFEFLTHHMRPEVERLAFQPVRAHALYHPPCQLRSHFIGTPALQVLARIPDLRVSVSGSDCCGIAGTYGLKSEKHEVAVAVGQTLFEQAEGMDFVICDSETCRWWIAQHTGLPVLHPIEVVARSLGLAN
jgi:glycerol-3-phosphate dehydrogenase subunit C